MKYITVWIEKNVVAIFIDLKKAFDVVDHSLLLSKLEKLGFRGISLKLLESYLDNRRQFVSWDERSSFNTVKCGVPQGSVLGPLLYLIYVLNLSKTGLLAQYYTFADDTVLVYTHHKHIELEHSINTDLKKYRQWLLRNNLKLNEKKTVYMSFRVRNKVPIS